MTYARFAATPIGANLAARDGGLTLATLDTGATGTARSDVGNTAGIAGIEFAIWGDDDQAAIIGLCTDEASLDQRLGEDSASIGWDLAAGVIRRGNVPLASGLPAVNKQAIVGVRIDRSLTRVQFFIGATVVHEGPLQLAGTLHFGACLGGTKPGGLAIAVNAGQWRARSPAAATGWRVSTASPAAARLSDLDYLSDASDTTPHARYEGLLVEGVTIVEALGWWPSGEQQPVTGGGAEATVVDQDGRLDALLTAEVAGAPISIRRGVRGGSVADATAIARYTLEGISVVDDIRRRLQLRDPHDDLDQVINRSVFLPNVPALAWRAMPVVIGAVASVPALSANSDGTVRFLADASVHIGDVMDRGDLMEPGTFELATDGQQLLMKSPPVGPVVCDASSMGLLGGEPQPATLQQALRDVMGRIGKSAWSAADAAAIDTATGYAGIGYFASDAVTARTAMVALLNTYGAWFYRDPTGTLRFVRTVAPESAAPTFEIHGADMASDLVRVADRAPALTRRMAYRLNAQALGAADLVTDFVDLPQARRDQLTTLWRGQAFAAGPLSKRYAHADAADPFLSLLWREQDARAEAERVVGIYSVDRNLFEASFRGTLDQAPRPGAVGTLFYGRYGLAGGRPVQVRRVSRVEGTGAVSLTLWG